MDRSNVNPAAVSKPKTLEEAVRAAQNMQRHGDLSAAEAVYLRILQVIPEEPNALHFLGILRHQQGDNEGATALIRRAIGVVPLDAGPWVNLGNIMLEMRRFDEAVDAYKQAAVLSPDNLLVHNNIGLLQGRRNNLDLAEAAYLQALRIAPDADYVLQNYAGLLHRLGRYEEATSFSIKTLSASPNDPKARRLLSISYALVGDLESARGVLRDWLELDPGNPEALHLLAGAGGLPVPARASDAYIAEEFDAFAKSFDAKLEMLGYKAPELVTRALAEALDAVGPAGDVLDAGCGTGLCSILLRPMARRLDGVDLSRGMLSKAAERGGYDQLECAELTSYMAGNPCRWDSIVSADTLCYFGDLHDVLVAARIALKLRGLLVFSVEAASSEIVEFSLQHNGRYAHGRSYIEGSVAAAGLELLSIELEILRAEVMRPVRGWIVVARHGAVAQPQPQQTFGSAPTSL